MEKIRLNYLEVSYLTAGNTLQVRELFSTLLDGRPVTSKTQLQISELEEFFPDLRVRVAEAKGWAHDPKKLLDIAFHKGFRESGFFGGAKILERLWPSEVLDHLKNHWRMLKKGGILSR